jgi:4'-phosphopantetheinyl transferase
LFETLQRGEAHLWRLSLREWQEGRLTAGLFVLHAEERARYEQARHRQYRELLLAGRLLLRCVLSAYGERRPEEWEIGIGPQGKPYVLNGPEGLAVNLSHTGGMAVVAAAAAAVGVDVEQTGRRLDPLVTGRPVFSAAEMAGLRSLEDEAARRERFFRIWTVKESLVKAIGAGITSDLRRVTIDVSGAVPRLVETVPSLPVPPDVVFFAKSWEEGLQVGGTIFPSGPISAILDQDAATLIRRTIDGREPGV